MTQMTILTTREVALRLRCDVRTVHRLIAAGELDAAKLPGKTGAYVIDPQSLSALIKERGL